MDTDTAGTKICASQSRSHAHTYRCAHTHTLNAHTLKTNSFTGSYQLPVLYLLFYCTLSLTQLQPLSLPRFASHVGPLLSTPLLLLHHLSLPSLPAVPPPAPPIGNGPFVGRSTPCQFLIATPHTADRDRAKGTYCTSCTCSTGQKYRAKTKRYPGASSVLPILPSSCPPSLSALTANHARPDPLFSTIPALKTEQGNSSKVL